MPTLRIAGYGTRETIHTINGKKIDDFSSFCEWVSLQHNGEIHIGHKISEISGGYSWQIVSSGDAVPFKISDGKVVSIHPKYRPKEETAELPGIIAYEAWEKIMSVYAFFNALPRKLCETVICHTEATL